MRKITIVACDSEKRQKYMKAIQCELTKGNAIMLSSPLQSFLLFNELRLMFSELGIDISPIIKGHKLINGNKIPAVKCLMKPTPLFCFDSEFTEKLEDFEQP